MQLWDTTAIKNVQCIQCTILLIVKATNAHLHRQDCPLLKSLNFDSRQGASSCRLAQIHLGPCQGMPLTLLEFHPIHQHNRLPAGQQLRQYRYLLPFWGPILAI